MSRRNWRYTNQEMNDEMMKFISKCDGELYICIHPDYIEDKVTELCAYLMTNEVKFKKREYNKFYKEKYKSTMSKIVRDKFNKEHQMPTTKVMGTVSPVIATKINQMDIFFVDTSEAKTIVDTINTILKTQITDINADQFSEPFVSETKMNVDYSTPMDFVFLSSIRIDKCKNWRQRNTTSRKKNSFY